MALNWHVSTSTLKLTLNPKARSNLKILGNSRVTWLPAILRGSEGRYRSIGDCSLGDKVSSVEKNTKRSEKVLI
ncbi:hypothetical protein KQX54_011477 [Cotesia glomerata]|uniref:Uncharacterized protein n=1 Tax=Cotesia glomerata TaxID=32391 RepID=A0AAV7IPP7_COTGL|nr:hypothetical protein KQX54_011477 [Cotesia glomerata]